jgi:phage terminase large subunit
MIQNNVIEFPENFEFLFEPHTYKVVYGGRGGMKSWQIARALLLLAWKDPLRILCAREYQTSIKESVHFLLCEQIELLGLSHFYNFTERSISGTNGSQFIFAGLKTNIQSIKSLEAINITWIEEAQCVSKTSLDFLIPTVIRIPGAELWFSFNPDQESDPVYSMFVKNTPPANAVVVETNYLMNNYLSPEMLEEAESRRINDYDGYLHIWMGQCIQYSASRVLHGKCVSYSFEPQEDWAGPYYGVDFGFTDPTTLVKCWVYEKVLYVEKESYKTNLEQDHMLSYWSMTIPEVDNVRIYADCSRPETISYLRRNGIPNIVGCTKYKGSVDDGVSFLRGCKQIVIHQDCKHTLEESKLWSWKIDDKTGEVIQPAVLKPGNDHTWDAIRYAFQDVIKSSYSGLLQFYKNQIEEIKEENIETKPERQLTTLDKIKLMRKEYEKNRV